MNKNDEKALKLLKVIEEKKKQLKKLSKPSYNTNMTFYYSEEGKNINLNVINDVERLCELFGFLSSKIKQKMVAAHTLGVELEEPTYNSFTLEEWTKDFKTKVEIINIKEAKADLEKREAAIDKVITPEKKTELMLQIMEDELG